MPVPTITLIDANHGPSTGDTPVTITGTNFANTPTVAFGGVLASEPHFVDATTFTCKTPSHSAGPVDVTLVNPNGDVVTSPLGFTYDPPPTVTSLDVTSGPTTGGTAITITGTGFQTSAKVTIGGIPATNVVRVNATTITCKTQVHAAGFADVVVTNPDDGVGELPLGFQYLNPAPTVTAIAPDNGTQLGNTPVLITGTGFVAGAVVDFGGTPVLPIAMNATQISCRTPPHAPGQVDVSVLNPDSQTGTLPLGFTFNDAPAVAAVAPGNGPIAGGTAVTITGSGFKTGASVAFGGAFATAVAVTAPNQITCITPAHVAGPVDVVVTNPDGQSGTLPIGFTFNGPPVVADIAPPEGPLTGTPVTISGFGFLDQPVKPVVKFGGAAAGNVQVLFGGSQITCDAPPHAAGAVDVQVNNPDGQSTTIPGGFFYKAPAPSVLAISPPEGPTAGNTTVTIDGTAFQNPPTAKFAGAQAALDQFVDATQFRCVTPPGIAGPADVEVINPDGQSFVVPLGYTYDSPPDIQPPLVPDNGPDGGNTLVTIFGANFQTGADVTFGGGGADDVTVDATGTSLTCINPGHLPGPVDVVITNPDGQSVTLPAGYTYNAAVAGPAPAPAPAPSPRRRRRPAP